MAKIPRETSSRSPVGPDAAVHLASSSVQERFFRVALARPHAIAVRTESATATYGDLAGMAGGIMERLAEEGVAQGARVCILCSAPVDFIAAYIGVLSAGCIASPLDGQWPGARLTQILTLLRSEAAVGDRVGLERIAGHAPSWLQFKSVEVPRPGLHPSTIECVTVGPDHPCYVVFTSGSTGKPKGIVGRTESLAHFIEWETRALAVGDSDVVPLLAPPGFDAVLRDIFTPLCAGGTVFAPDDRALLHDPHALLARLQAVGVTVWHTTPHALRQVLQTGNASRLTTLRAALTSGEALLVGDAEKWINEFGESVELWNLYGPSETTMIKLVHHVKRSDLARARIPIGRPIDGCTAFVLDAAGQMAGPGVMGQIHLRTRYRSLGYLDRPDLTHEVFVPDPANPDSGGLVYATGDLGRLLEDGSLEFFGRSDDQVKIRGVRVEPAEVEQVLRRHRTVLDIAVLADKSNPEVAQLCAYVVLKDDADFRQVGDFASERLVPAMIPTAWFAVERIPRTRTDKVDRVALLSMAREPAQEILVPRSPLEKAVAEIMMDALQIDRLDLGASFFLVGGHSLLAVHVLSRIQEAFGVAPQLSEFLVRPTAENLAISLEAALMQQHEDDEALQSLVNREQFGGQSPSPVG